MIHLAYCIAALGILDLIRSFFYPLSTKKIPATPEDVAGLQLLIAYFPVLPKPPVRTPSVSSSTVMPNSEKMAWQ
jgi:hypothetical protein